MQIAELWPKRLSVKAAAAALLGVECCSHTEYMRFWQFLPKHGIKWLEKNFYPPEGMDMFDDRVNDYDHCVMTLAEGAKVAEIINQQQHDLSCANTGLPYTQPKKVQRLAATIKKLNKPLPDEDVWYDINRYGVIEMPFDVELLRCEDKLFHVRRCSQL